MGHQDLNFNGGGSVIVRNETVPDDTYSSASGEMGHRNKTFGGI